MPPRTVSTTTGPTVGEGVHAVVTTSLAVWVCVCECVCVWGEWVGGDNNDYFIIV